MGGRMLRKWLLKPLRDVELINERLDAVDEFFHDSAKRSAVRSILSRMGDIERLCGKMASRKATPRDVVALKEALERIPRLGDAVGRTGSALLERCREKLVGFPEVVERIGGAIVDDPPAQLGAGGVIRDGYDGKLDELREIKRNGTRWIARLQEEERRRTGIQSLKVGYNKVFGYYIEVTKPNLGNVPGHYIRKQTIANGERFVTEELKEMEMKILTAQEKLESLEAELFSALREELAGRIDEFKEASEAVAVVDLAASLAEAARENGYTRPMVNERASISIREG
jgi:DNA mismatch repair protein MutS